MLLGFRGGTAATDYWSSLSLPWAPECAESSEPLDRSFTVSQKLVRTQDQTTIALSEALAAYPCC